MLAIRALILVSSLAADPAKPPAKTKPKPKAPSISIPSFGAIPKGENLIAPKAEKLGPTESTVPVTSAAYAVVKVQHAKNFTRSPAGATPVGGALENIALVGNPPATEKFTTVVRIKCPQRVSAAIDLVIMDPRGDTVMTAAGEVSYRGLKEDEAEYTVEWEPTPWPQGGQFSLLIRVGGQVMGTWPLKVGGPAK